MAVESPHVLDETAPGAAGRLLLIVDLAIEDVFKATSVVFDEIRKCEAFAATGNRIPGQGSLRGSRLLARRP